MSNNQNKLEGIEESTFATPILSKSTPVTNALERPLKMATGTIFKVLAGSEETIKEDNAEVIRAVYRVQPLNSKLLPLSSELEIKIKGQPSLLSEEDNVKIVFNSKMIIAAFDELARWSFNGKEGLSAKGIRFLNVSAADISKLIRGEHA